MKRLILTTSLIFLCFCFLFPQEKKPEKTQLTLMDCMLKALENNLDISVEAFRPDISEYSIRQSREYFMPQLSFGYDNFSYNQPSNWYVEGDVYSQKTDSYSLNLEQNVITGGRVTLSLSNSTTDTTRSLTIVNPTYSSNLRLNFTQPLLKNFGPNINRRDVKKAQNQRDISVFGLKSTIIQKVYDVEEAYWNLVMAIESLSVSEYSLEHSREQLIKTKEAARIGAKTAIDVLSSETEVANWESNIISARAQVESAEDRLRKIMNLPVDASGLSESILPTDKPLVEKVEITFEEALKVAVKERPELSSKQKEIENSNIDVSYYKNQLLPQLDLRFNMWYPGQSGDLLIYEGGSPYYSGVVIGKIEGSRGDSLKDVFDFKYENWQISLDFTIPLGNVLSRASLAQARLQNDQKLLERERLSKSVYNEILEIFKELKNNEKSMETSSRYRELMEKKLSAEEERHKLGLVGSEWLFRYQRDFASARTSEIRAIVNYKISVAKLEKALGINMKTKNLKFRSYDF